MLNVFRGVRPDITPAQVLSGIPIIATLLHAFGIYDLTGEQQDALAKAVEWAFVLIGGDALLRAARNYADARRDAAALAAPDGPIGFEEELTLDDEDLLDLEESGLSDPEARVRPDDPGVTEEAA